MHLRKLILAFATGALAVHNHHQHLHKHLARDADLIARQDSSDGTDSNTDTDVDTAATVDSTGLLVQDVVVTPDPEITATADDTTDGTVTALDATVPTSCPPPSETYTVEYAEVSAVVHFDTNTIVDPLLNGRAITITNAPIDLLITGILTVTRGPTVVTTRTSSTTRTTTTRTSTTRTSSTSTRTSSTSSRSSTLSSIVTSSTTATTTTRISTTTTSYPPYTPTPPANGTYYVSSTILVIVRNQADGNSATSGLNGYGIPFEILYVPSSGANLPTLNNTNGGNYGGIIISGQVSYDYGGTFRSALTDAQYQQLYDYQTMYGVRMVQYDVYPGPLFGSTALGGCCGAGIEQYISFTNTVAQSGLRTGQDMSTLGLYHYPASVSDTATTREIARFATSSNGVTGGTAAVINNFSGREQMVFFISWATDFSATSNYLQHEYITWMTRGLYSGFRRVYLNTQIDDMFLSTGLYRPINQEYRVVPADMQDVANWVPTIQAKLNPGSFYLPEVGHNGNGNIEYATYNVSGGEARCAPGSIEYDEVPDTPLEFKKPLGSGTNRWPTSPTVYGYSRACSQTDPLYNWWASASNRDRFMHISHTFTHLELNNATYSDALKEIQFNQAWLQQIGFTAGRFTANGLIPPAITGLHNGDVLRAWTDAGLQNCVGDNTRPLLRNSVNTMWPYTTTFASDGFDGYTVIPRWATRIYYNCDTPSCTTQEWIDTSAGSGDFQTLLNVEKADTIRHLFGLFHEGYMFHQANLRTQGIAPITINGQTSQISIFQAWVETIVQEFVRIATWPMITLTQADLTATFLARQQRDSCRPNLFWNKVGSQITSMTVTTNGNVCGTEVPVTIPLGTTVNTGSYRTEQVGSDAQTVWIQFNGAPVTFTFSTPIQVVG